MSDLFFNSVEKFVSKLKDRVSISLATLESKVSTPSVEKALIAIAVSLSTLLTYRQYREWKERRKYGGLNDELERSSKAVKDLERKLMHLEATDLGDDDTNHKVTIFMDGAYDMMHFGHMNAFRQGRSLGTRLIVGVNAGESIAENKGTPVMQDKERLSVVEACKWVDEVVPNVPYVMSEDYINWIIDEYDIDYIVHGDDPCIVNGKDVYAVAKAKGKYLEIPRTEGISTSDIVGRMLLMTTTHHESPSRRDRLASEECSVTSDMTHAPTTPPSSTQVEVQMQSALGARSRFLTTSHILKLFGAGMRAAPLDTDRVVYVGGSFDLLNGAHVELLTKARGFGDFLVVGIHADDDVNAYSGTNLPIMNLNERVLSVLGCRGVDDVLIGAPVCVTKEMIATLNISVVVTSNVDMGLKGSDATIAVADLDSVQLKEIMVKPLPVPVLIDRISKQRVEMQERYERKMQKESAWYNKKHQKHGIVI